MTPDAIFETVERFKPTVFYAAPTNYAGMLVALEKARQ